MTESFDRLEMTDSIWNEDDRFSTVGRASGLFEEKQPTLLGNTPEDRVVPKERMMWSPIFKITPIELLETLLQTQSDFVAWWLSLGDLDPPAPRFVLAEFEYIVQGGFIL